MNVKRLTLDTNILIYAVDRDVKEKHESAISVVDQAMRLDCCLTLQSLCEFYAAATRKKYAKHDEAALFIKELMVVFLLFQVQVRRFLRL
jgi:predicted nucleic acid-binding protein